MTQNPDPQERRPAAFDDDDLALRLDAMTDEERHGLPFGVIGLDREGRVRFYSRTEAAQSGYGSRPIHGLEFFLQVAPCMNTPEVRGRMQRGLDSGQLDLELGHTGDFADARRLLRIRAMSAAGGGLWLAHFRPSLQAGPP